MSKPLPTALVMLRAVEAAYLEANGWTRYYGLWENTGQRQFTQSQDAAVALQKTRDHTEDVTASLQGPVPYLEAVENQTFSPIGSLYASVFEGLRIEGLVHVAADGYQISNKGREYLKKYREEKNK